MKINISLYKSNKHGEHAVWAGYQVDVIKNDAIPSKQGYIVQYYSEHDHPMIRSNILGNKYKFNDMLKLKLKCGYEYAGTAELETNTGIFKEVN